MNTKSQGDSLPAKHHRLSQRRFINRGSFFLDLQVRILITSSFAFSCCTETNNHSQICLLQPLICVFYCAFHRREPPSSPCSFGWAAGRFLSRTTTHHVSGRISPKLWFWEIKKKRKRLRLSRNIISHVNVHYICTVVIWWVIWCGDTQQLHLFVYLRVWGESATLTHFPDRLNDSGIEMSFCIKFGWEPVWVSPLGACVWP